MASAQSGLQVSPDQRRVLVSKDVGAERWAISRDLADGAVSGNVFFPGGGSPRFVWCDQTGSSAASVMLSCSGSARCLLAPCGSEAWAFVADVSLPLSFFAPRGVGQALSCHATTQLTPQAASLPSGLQLSPGEGVTLVSKDVGAERWAIARQASDGSVTGNVFYPSGGDPKFVWCRQTGLTGGNFVLSCQGADACGATCSPSDWAFIAEVALPESFFRPRAQGSLVEIQARIEETLGADDGFVAFMLATDYGYSLEQIIHAVADDRLGHDGLIRRRSTSVEDPDGPALNVFIETPARPSAGNGPDAGALNRPRAGKVSVEDVRAAALDLPQMSSTILLGAVMDLAAQGYTLEQISEALYAGRFEEKLTGRFFNERWVWVILDERGQQVAPANLPRPYVEPPVQPTPQPTPRPTPSPTPPGGVDCGNGSIDGIEECDGSNLAGNTCIKLGFAGGTLRCTARCTYDVTGCTDLPPPTPQPTPPVCQGMLCPDGICVPIGSDCCGGGRYCPPGKLCVEGGKCCPVGAPTICGNLCIPLDAVCCGGVGYCYAGEVCVGGNTACCPASLPQLCGDSCIAAEATCCAGGGSCPGGTVCTGAPGVCCPVSFPQLCGSMCIPQGADCCGGGAGFCPPGSECQPDGTCSGYDGAAFASSVSIVEPSLGEAEACEARAASGAEE